MLASWCRQKRIPVTTEAYLAGLIALIAVFLIAFLTPYASRLNLFHTAVFFSGPVNLTFLYAGYSTLLIFALKDKRFADIKMALIVIISVTLIVQVLKLISGDFMIRPSGREGGFPSGHSAAAFALAFLLSSRFPKASALWFLVAVGIAWSRIEVGAHFPYQVCVGSTIGYCFALLLVDRKYPNICVQYNVHRYKFVLISLILVAAFVNPSFECENSLVSGLGTGIFLLGGIFLRAWARIHHNKSMRSKMPFCTTGPYSIIRQPQYLANVFICLGLTFAAETVWLLPLTFLVAFVVMNLAAASQESIYTAKYGDEYAAYAKRVPMWIPSFRNRITLKWSFAGWGSALKAEMPVFLLLLLPLLKEVLT